MCIAVKKVRVSILPGWPSSVHRRSEVVRKRGREGGTGGAEDLQGRQTSFLCDGTMDTHQDIFVKTKREPS